MRLKKIIYNIVFGFGGQLIILALGMIIPRLILVSFGSEMNGLLVTITQIFTYLALLEAGIGNATVNELYKPIVDNNREGIINVLSTTNKYYKKISIYYLLAVFVFAIFYPIIVKTEINKEIIFLVIILQGIPGVMNFYFISTYKQILIAEGKNYIISNITLIIYVLTSIIKIIIINNGADIIMVQLAYFILALIQIIIFKLYCRSKYGWIKFKKTIDISILYQRNAFLVHEISALIFSNTDVFILSLFCDLKTASIYAVYNIVFIALNQIIGVVNNSIVFVLGQIYHQDKSKYIKIHDIYDSYYVSFVFCLMSVAYMLINEFVKLYTQGVGDINYIDKYLPVLFCIIQLLSCSRAVSARLITISGHAEKTKNRSIIEAIINIMASVILVNIIGIYGVLIGTIIALIFRMNDIIIYANKKVLHRSSKKTYKNIFINIIIFIIFMNIKSKVNINIGSYFEFIIYGLIITILVGIIYFIIASIINKSEIKNIFYILKNKKIKLTNQTS